MFFMLNASFPSLQTAAKIPSAFAQFSDTHVYYQANITLREN